MTCAEFLAATAANASWQALCFLVLTVAMGVGTFLLYKRAQRNFKVAEAREAANQRVQYDPVANWLMTWVIGVLFMVFVGLTVETFGTVREPVTSGSAIYFCAENPPSLIEKK